MIGDYIKADIYLLSARAIVDIYDEKSHAMPENNLDELMKQIIGTNLPQQFATRKMPINGREITPSYIHNELVSFFAYSFAFKTPRVLRYLNEKDQRQVTRFIDAYVEQLHRTKSRLLHFFSAPSDVSDRKLFDILAAAVLAETKDFPISVQNKN